MCGRTDLSVTRGEQLEEHYQAKLIADPSAQGFRVPRYNIPPSAHVPVLTMEDEEEIQIGKWSFVPSWHKTGTKARLINNARVETVLEKPFFKNAILSRRCLIPVTGFFEWKTEDTRKTPYRFHMNGDIFSLGGIYTTTEDENGNKIPHFAVLTTEANALMAPIHDRIPVIIQKGDESIWIKDILEEQDIFKLMQTYQVDGLVKNEVSHLVNNPRNDNEEVIKALI